MIAGPVFAGSFQKQFQAGLGGRKVRAPQDAVMGNAHRPRGQGKCNRKQTAMRASARTVRVKR